MSPRVVELTSAGRGSVSVLALEGPGAAEAIARLADRFELPRASPVLARLSAGGERLDEALCLVWDGERAEIHVHGSPAVVARVRAALAALGCSAGEPGTEGRSASAEERAEQLLSRAPCEAAARILLDQANGALRRELARFALVDPPRWRAGLAALAERARVAAPALVPRRVVLAGPANAGKSTLFNALLGRERAVVDPRPGTTRDAVEAEARLGLWPAVLVDTAGAREPSGGPAERELESAAQARARESVRGADLVLWCEPDAARPPPRLELAPGAALVRITTRADELDPSSLAAAPEPISALRDPGRARARVAERFRAAWSLPADPWTPGSGVPFEPGIARGLAELAAIGGCDRRWTALAERLGSEPRTTGGVAAPDPGA